MKTSLKKSAGNGGGGSWWADATIRGKAISRGQRVAGILTAED